MTLEDNLDIMKQAEQAIMITFSASGPNKWQRIVIDQWDFRKLGGEWSCDCVSKIYCLYLQGEGKAIFYMEK